MKPKTLQTKRCGRCNARVNKYTVPLTKQELRRADFPGDFLELSETLAVDAYFDRAKLFSPANRRRYGDVEYVSELLAAMLDGVQDKKGSLDDFYVRYTSWPKLEKDAAKARFQMVLDDLVYIFDRNFEISETRFRQKADFYSLFLAIDEFIVNGLTVKGRNVGALQEDLRILDDNIRPESDVEICSEYAIKCVSQANSASSRKWRQQFLKIILERTYVGGLPDDQGARVLYRLKDDLCAGDSWGLCPVPVFICQICGEEISEDFSDCVVAWNQYEEAKHLGNSEWIHRRCADEQSDLAFLERAK